MKAILVEVCERANDRFEPCRGQRMPMYHACVAGDLARWGCGNSVESALDDLCRSHYDTISDRASLEVRYLGVMPR